MQTVNVEDAKTHFPELLDRVLEGETVQIARKGITVAELAPASAAKVEDPGGPVLNYLLDTHALLSVDSPQRLTPKVHAVIESRQARVSVVSLWKLIIKKNRKTAPVRDPLLWWEQHVTGMGTEVISIRMPHFAKLDSLPEL